MPRGGNRPGAGRPKLDKTPRLLCFDPQGQVVAQFGREKLQRAAGMAIDLERRRLYVADAKAHRIAVFNPDNYAFERYIGEPSTPGAREPGKFAAPTNVAVDRHGTLYVQGFQSLLSSAPFSTSSSMLMYPHSAKMALFRLA